jgi:poly(3-hydroxybutyrate) depolymerase
MSIEKHEVRPSRETRETRWSRRWVLGVACAVGAAGAVGAFVALTGTAAAFGLGAQRDELLASFRPTTTAVPLIVDLHGARGNPIMQKRASQLYACALKESWHIVWPEGFEHSWNAGVSHHPPSSTLGIRHVEQLTELIRGLRSTRSVSHVFLAGFSNGCAMALRLGLEAEPGLLDAIACTSHTLRSSPVTHTPVPLLLLTGDTDEWWASATDVNRTLEAYRAINGCSNATTEIGEDTTSTSYMTCSSPLHHVLFRGHGHMLPFDRTSALQCAFFRTFVA